MNQHQHYVIFIFGVSGSGKSTIGKSVAEKLRVPFFDADDFHSQANRTKMTTGISLNDEDRKDWLARINQLAVEEVKQHPVVISCSALKELYRKQLMNGIEKQCKWFLLKGGYEMIAARMSRRTNHFMPSSLLQSQFDLLEIPSYAFLIDIQLSPQEIVDLILSHIKK